MTKIKVSAKNMRQQFNGCDPDYIRDVCHARCCQSSTSDIGIVVTIHPEEEAAIRSRGGDVQHGLLQPNEGERVCPFKDKQSHLCSLHFTPDKPFGCIASPFTLNKADTLIVRNRYRLLKCYGDRHPSNRKIPAYIAFDTSLILIFGEEGYQKLKAHLDSGGGDIIMLVANEGVYEKLKTNDTIKKQAMKEKRNTDGKTKKVTNVSGTLGKSFPTMYPYDGYEQQPGTVSMSGTSIFDPVLCELVYRWFCPTEGTVLDPFAGGSVRGIVAAKLGLQYVGVELRREQVEANRMQGDDICAGDTHPPVWHCGDSRNIGALANGVEVDLVFSCPPYADLEVYSDDPKDISTLTYDEFIEAYRHIIAESCALLKDDRFAVWVVGDVRDKQGFYRDFIGDTKAAFRDCGLKLYNEAILLTAIGSLPIRVGNQFSSGRKLGKAHQNVFCFYKGNPKNIKDAFGAINVDDSFLESEEEDAEMIEAN